MRFSLIPKESVLLTIFQHHADNTSTIAVALADLLEKFTNIVSSRRAIARTSLRSPRASTASVSATARIASASHDSVSS